MLFKQIPIDGVHEPVLGQDQALLNIQSSVSSDLGLYYRHEECYRCPYTLAGPLAAGQNVTYMLDVTRGWKLAVMDDRRLRVSSVDEISDNTCSINAHLGARGHFQLNVSEAGCSVHTMLPPADTVTPLWAACVLLLIVAVVHGLGSAAVSWFYSQRDIDADDEKQHVETPPTDSSDCPISQHTTLQEKLTTVDRKRNLAVDTFRGLAIMMMIFVNDWEGQYWFFQHAVWNGLLFADVVFPWFLWIMGVCIPLSLASQIRRGKNTRCIIYHVIKRSVWLLLIGISLNSVAGDNNLKTYRLLGVLQRLAASYLIVAIVTLPAMLRKPPRACDERPSDSSPSQSCFVDIKSIIPQWWLMLVLIVLHTALTFALPVPGCPTGYLGPGGLYDNASVPASCVGGAAGYIDRLVLGVNHLYQKPTASFIYQSEPFDPENLLGTLSSSVTVFLGVQAGMILYSYGSWWRRVVRLMSWSAICGLIALVLSLGSQEGGAIPINKNLWSISFVFATGSLAFLVFTLIFVLTDVLRWWSGSPLVYPGRNALAMYIGHSIAYKMFPFHWSYGQMNGHIWTLSEKLWGLACWMVLAIWMHEKGYFWKL